jgi:general secretion pathway protein G
VVIAIIGILAGVIIPTAFRAIEKSKIARAVHDVRSIKGAALAFYNDTGLWPGGQWGPMYITGWSDPKFRGDPYSPADQPSGEGFTSRPIVHGGSAAEQAMGNNGLPYWQGPYLDKWSFSPWGWPYMWDVNDWDATHNGVAVEHVIWFDLAPHPGPYDLNPKIPQRARDKLDKIFDGSDGLSTGLLQEMMEDPTYGTSVLVVVFEGF